MEEFDPKKYKEWKNKLDTPITIDASIFFGAGKYLNTDFINRHYNWFTLALMPGIFKNHSDVGLFEIDKKTCLDYPEFNLKIHPAMWTSFLENLDKRYTDLKCENSDPNYRTYRKARVVPIYGWLMSDYLKDGKFSNVMTARYHPFSRTWKLEPGSTRAAILYLFDDSPTVECFATVPHCFADKDMIRPKRLFHSVEDVVDYVREIEPEAFGNSDTLPKTIFRTEIEYDAHLGYYSNAALTSFREEDDIAARSLWWDRLSEFFQNNIINVEAGSTMLGFLRQNNLNVFISNKNPTYTIKLVAEKYDQQLFDFYRAILLLPFFDFEEELRVPAQKLLDKYKNSIQIIKHG